jgi:HK97 family phage portal protein
MSKQTMGGVRVSKILQFFGIDRIETRFSEPNWSGQLPTTIPPSRSGASDITLDRALTIPAAFRAITILATAVSQLELSAWRSGVEVSPSPALVRKPDANRPLSDFLKRTVICLAGTGNAYWRKHRDASGMVASLQVLNPFAISWEFDKNGRKWYRYNGSLDKINKDEIQHLRYMDIPGHEEGVGPIQANRETFQNTLILREYARTAFDTTPVGVLSTDKELTPDEADQAKVRWNELMADRGIAVLGKGLGFAPTIISPEDAQFLENQQFSVTEIANIFGIPAPYLLAAVQGNSMTYQNLESVDTQFVKYGLMTYLKVIEDAMTEVLVRGQKAQFKLDTFLRPDAKTQAEIHQIYLMSNVLSRAEVRQQKGWTGPPPPEEKPVVQPVPVQEPANE